MTEPAPIQADLAGVMIVDFSPTVGTLTTSALADMGAEVIHVGRPTPPDRLEPVGRNKRSIALDLKSDTGRRVAQTLAARADVVVEGFRPGVADRLGIGYTTLRAGNPGLVYCSLSGYGQDGPYAQWAGHDLNYQGVSGAVQFDDDDRPLMPSGPWADRAAGYHLQLAILRGLLARELQGIGQRFDVALVDAMATVPLREQYSVDGVGRMPTGGMSGSSLPKTEMIRGDYCWYGMYQCADGGWISVGCLESRFWAGLCEAMGHEEWRPDQFAGPAKQAAMRTTLETTFRSRPRAAWLAMLTDEADLPIAPIHHVDEAARDPHLAHRGSFVPAVLPGGQAMLQIAPPMRGASPYRMMRSMTVTGLDTVEILRDLGWTEVEIASALDEGAVQANAFPDGNPRPEPEER